MGDKYDAGKQVICKTESSDCDKTEAVEEGQVSEVSDKLPQNQLEQQFSEKTWKEDLSLIVGDTCLYVTKYILGIKSKVFSARFKEGPIDEMKLSGTSVKSVVEFLRCIYPDIRKPVTIENVRLVMPLACEYECEELMAECESCIGNAATKTASVEVLLHLAELCRKLRLSSLEDICWKAIEEKDVQKSGALKRKLSDTHVSETTATVKVKTLKHMVNDNISVCTALQEERNEVKRLKRNFHVFMKQQGIVNLDEATTIMEGEVGKICLTTSKPYTQISDQSNNKYKLFIKHWSYEKDIELWLKADCDSSIRGQLTLVNQVNMDNDRSLNFYATFSKAVKEVNLGSMSKAELTDESKGFLAKKEIMIEIEYISKAAVAEKP